MSGPIPSVITPAIQRILSFYESDNPGTKTNLARLLMQGRLGGTGRLIILPIDQGFEHGPARSFAKNPAGYDPHYHFQLAIDAGLSALAAPLGFLEAGAATFAGQIPTILKLNSSNSLIPSGTAPAQATTASIRDALRLGCVAVGFTLYPGSDNAHGLIEEFQEIAAEAKAHGLAVIAWSYPRGHLSKAGETAIDVISYAAHMAALLGAHIIKVKLPIEHIEQAAATTAYTAIDRSTLAARIRHVVETCFQGRRLVIFSGGSPKEDHRLLEEAQSIVQGGGNGTIIGRNVFQRPRTQALALLDRLITIYT